MEIKKEKLAKRCEICHQEDCYNAEENNCSRCNSIILTRSNNFVEKTTKPRDYIMIICTIIMSLVGGVVGMFLTYFLVGIIYLIFDNTPVTNGEECARGMAIGLLSMFFGAIIGAIFSAIKTYHSFVRYKSAS